MLPRCPVAARAAAATGHESQQTDRNCKAYSLALFSYVHHEAPGLGTDCPS